MIELLPLALTLLQPAPAAGTVVAREPYALPAYAQLPGWARREFSPERYEAYRSDERVRLTRIVYLSDGLRVGGFIYEPRATSAARLPLVVFCRAGVGEAAAIGAGTFANLYEMRALVDGGFIVLAPQYRGVDGGQGKDEVGGADLDDVMNLLPVVRSLENADQDRLFLWGASRGGQMVLQALRAGFPARAAVTVGAPVDWGSAMERNPGLRRLALDHWPGFEREPQPQIERRSAIRWAEAIEPPLLIFHGAADERIPVDQALDLGRRLSELGKLFELVVYANDDHPVSINREDRLRRTIDWFARPRRLPVSRVLSRKVRSDGVGAAVELYRSLRAQGGDRYDFAESELNALGYERLRAGSAPDALEIFKLNLEAYPDSGNAHDSLAEAYAAAGQVGRAIEHYERALALDPSNANARELIARLGIEAAAAAAVDGPFAIGTLEVVARDYSLELPARARAGLVTFRFSNRGSEPHYFRMLRVSGDHSLADFLAWRRLRGPLPAWLAAAGGIGTIARGESVEFTARLDAGRYVAFCGHPSPDGVQHVDKGMFAELSLETPLRSIPTPPADSSIVLLDHAIEISKPLRLGRQIVHVRNAGSRPHQALLVRVPDAATADRELAWFRDGSRGPRPGHPVGGVIELAPAAEAWVTLDLVPGPHVLFCAVTGDDGRRHFDGGMIERMDVK